MSTPVAERIAAQTRLARLRRIGEMSRIGVDYQWKNGVTFNDDKLNTEFAVRWNLVY